MELTKFGKYTLLDHMGRGGVASVYRASDSSDGSIVAVKVFESTPERPPETGRKLRDREVRMLSCVRHPNIVTFRESGQVDESYYYAMEFVENSLLKRMRNGKPLTLIDKVVILRQTASALAAIHHKGIVHRDIKPGNILLDEDPNGAMHVKLTDFGIAKNVSETDVVREQMPTRVHGTLKYLSPEQIKKQAVDGRSDIFSLGVVAYELLTGLAPFKAETTEEYLAANSEEKQMPAHQLTADVPPFLGEMVERMLVKDREERYDSDTLSRDLELVQQHLVSGAAMVERTNPISMFYLQSEELAEAASASREARLALVSWAAAGAIVTIGVIVLTALWPGKPRPVQREARAQPAAPGAAELLKEAESAANDGRHWQALAALRSLQASEFSPEEQGRFDVALENAQEALAGPSFDAGTNMVAEGRTAEAEILLGEMKDFFPKAQRTLELAGALRRQQARASRGAKWQETLQNSYGLVRRGQYKEALEARTKLLAEVSADPAKAGTVRKAIGDLLDSWASYLNDGRPSAETLEAFFAAADAQHEAAPGKPSAQLAGRLRMKLGRIYAAAGEHDAALKQYESAMGLGDAAIAAQAKKASDELRTWVTGRPHEAADFAQALLREGFGPGLWSEHNEAEGTQQITDGVVQLRAQAGTGKAALYRETTRPVRNRGFSAGVQFKSSGDLIERPGTSQAGIAVTGTDGSGFRLAFDGRAYLVTVFGKAGAARGSSAGSVVQKAIGDEDQAWHALGLNYNFNTGQMDALLDGKAVGRYSLNLSDFRLRVFAEAGPGAAAGADFKDVFCHP